MIKIDLSRTIAERMGITIKQTDEFLNVWTDLVGECLEKGDPVQLAGLGQFTVRFVPKHTGRNPKSGEALLVPACYYPIFKAGKGLKDRVAKYQPTVEQAETDAKAIETKTSSPSPKPDCKKKRNASVEESV